VNFRLVFPGLNAACPHCGARLTHDEKSGLHPRGSFCDDCGGMYRSSWLQLFKPLVLILPVGVAVHLMLPEPWAPIGLLALVAAFVLAVPALFAKPIPIENDPGEPLKLSALGEHVQQLVNQPIEDGFIAFALPGPDGLPINDVSLQFSIEEGSLGFDWVCINRSNERDRLRFRRLAEEWGYTVTPRNRNGVAYLRVEQGGDLLVLCRRAVERLYGAGPDTEVRVVARELGSGAGLSVRNGT
jgi:hypothetical protein